MFKPMRPCRNKPPAFKEKVNAILLFETIAKHKNNKDRKTNIQR